MKKIVFMLFAITLMVSPALWAGSLEDAANYAQKLGFAHRSRVDNGLANIKAGILMRDQKTLQQGKSWLSEYLPKIHPLFVKLQTSVVHARGENPQLFKTQSVKFSSAIASLKLKLPKWLKECKKASDFADKLPQEIDQNDARIKKFIKTIDQLRTYEDDLFKSTRALTMGLADLVRQKQQQ